MQTEQGPRYSGVAMLLHWLIAIAVIVNWRIAESAENLSQAERGAVMNNHFALGLTILVLTLLRVIWRLVHRPPPLASTLKPWERALARTTHTIFYVLLIGLPLGAWIGLSGFRATIDYWGLFSIAPLPVGFGKDTGEQILEAHAAGGTFILLLIALHILGALKHTLWDKDGNLWRMLPFGIPKA